MVPVHYFSIFGLLIQIKRGQNCCGHNKKDMSDKCNNTLCFLKMTLVARKNGNYVTVVLLSDNT